MIPSSISFSSSALRRNNGTTIWRATHPICARLSPTPNEDT